MVLERVLPGIPHEAIIPAGIQPLQEKVIRLHIQSRGQHTSRAIIPVLQEAAVRINQKHRARLTPNQGAVQTIGHLLQARLAVATDLQLPLSLPDQATDLQHLRGPQDQVTGPRHHRDQVDQATGLHLRLQDLRVLPFHLAAGHPVVLQDQVGADVRTEIKNIPQL